MVGRCITTMAFLEFCWESAIKGVLVALAVRKTVFYVGINT